MLLYLLSYSNLNQTCTVLIKELASLTLNKLLHVEKTLTNWHDGAVSEQHVGGAAEENESI